MNKVKFGGVQRISLCQNVTDQCWSLIRVLCTVLFYSSPFPMTDRLTTCRYGQKLNPFAAYESYTTHEMY